MRLLRRRPTKHARALMARAREAHAKGDFAAARRALAGVVADAGAPPEAIRGMAELEYLLGSYDSAERLLRRVVAGSRKDAQARAEAEAALALVHLQTNEFAATRELFAGVGDAVDMPIWRLMTSFGDTRPYAIDWPAERWASIPLAPRAWWQLPSVPVEVEGRALEASIDTGGDLLSLPAALADELGVEPVVTFTAGFAGDSAGRIGYAKVASVRIGGVEVRNVPVAVSGIDRPVIGTGLLRQFLATIDYPQQRLILRPAGSARAPSDQADGAQVVTVPFALALTHLIVARGSLDQHTDLTFLVDSGLEDQHGAAFAAPADTLELARLAIPDTALETGPSVVGEVSLRLGRFPIARLGLGPLVMHDAVGLYGAFPAQLQAPADFRIHGLISHNFLRRYAWTLDFSAMTMTFQSSHRRPGGRSLTSWRSHPLPSGSLKEA